MDSAHLPSMSGLSTTSRIFSYYPLSISSVSQSNGPSTRSYHSNNHNSSSLQSNLSNKNKYSKLQGPRLPSYLVDTTFADLYIASSSESYKRNGSVSDSDQASFALPTAWNIDDKSPYLELSEDRLRVNYTGDKRLSRSSQFHTFGVWGGGDDPAFGRNVSCSRISKIFFRLEEL